MFRKYEKTFRVIIPQTKSIKGKLHLTKDERKALIGGRVEITEKIDGANVGIVRSKNGWTLQKRRGLADEGVHAQFSFFWNWARHNEEKIMKIPKGYIIYGELTYAKHHIFYDNLPSYFVSFDVWNGKKYLKHNERIELIDNLGFQHVPVIHYGYVDFEELQNIYDVNTAKSKFSSTEKAEGIYIKNFRRQMKGKIVRPEFVKEIDEEGHWMHSKIRKNKLAEGVGVYD